MRVENASELERAVNEGTALAIEILPGTYKNDLKLRRPVALFGPQSGGTILVGTIDAESPSIRLADLEIRGHVKIKTPHLTLERVRLKSDAVPVAVAIADASGAVTDLDVECGGAICVHVKSSSITMSTVALHAQTRTKRGLVIEKATVTAERVSVARTQIAQIQVQDGQLRITDAKLNDALGMGLVALESKLYATRVANIEGRGTAMVMRQSNARLTKVDLGQTGDSTLGIQGGRVAIHESMFRASKRGVVNVTGFRKSPAQVWIKGGQFLHGALTGLMVDQGHVRVDGTKFTGSKGRSDGDAIVASGNLARVDLKNVEIRTPAASGVGFYNDAGGDVHATIIEPGRSGVYAETNAGQTIRILRTVVRSCRRGSGVALFDSLDVSVDGLEVSKCAGGGLVAGDGTEATAQNLKLVDNGQFGLAAFSEAIVKVNKAEVRGSRWAAFSACGHAGRVVDLGGNRLRGATTLCP